MPARVQEPVVNISHAVLSREYGDRCRGATRGVQKAMLNDQIEQHQLTHIAGVEKRFNKAFCLEWLDERTILFGTKCNRLIKLDILTHKHQNVPTPPEPAQRSAPDLFAADPWHAVGGGIHALETSPCGRYLATGARNPHDALVLRRHDLTPVQTCMGHVDWIFGIAWVRPEHFVTASRDYTVKLWQVQDPGGGEYREEAVACQHSVLAHECKVRATSYDPQRDQLVTMSVDGCSRLWSPDFLLKDTFEVKRKDELVAAAMSGPVVAFGSKRHITLYDLRMDKRSGVNTALAGELEVTQDGVRSITIQDHLMSYGTGDGVIGFHDLRMRRRKKRTLCPDGDVDPGASWGRLPQQVGMHKMGLGYIRPPQGEHGWWLSQYRSVACYSHKWCPNRTKLMAVGGPITVGVDGCCLVVCE